MNQPESVVALLIKDNLICRVTRRHKPGDFSLVGGSIDSTDLNPWNAMAREVWEEVGVTVLEAHKIFERVDSTSGQIAWCYHVTQWEGNPHQCEDGIEVSWGDPQSLLTEICTFREYNRQLFEQLKLL